VRGFFNVNAGGAYSNHCAFKVRRVLQFVCIYELCKISGIIFDDIFINISRFIFVMETRCVYCRVRITYLYINF
jgi:hypothetical protein